MTRCTWAEHHPLLQEYHDREWGVPLHDDRTHFEFLVLDGAQAGLSWLTVLKKRENYRRAFAEFDPAVVANFGQEQIDRLLADPGIIRNRAKVAGAVTNARAFLAVQAECGSFDAFIWSLVGGKTRINAWQDATAVPARSPDSDAMSRELVRRGFKFVGSTICYAYMQAAGMVLDHMVDCFRYAELCPGGT